MRGEACSAISLGFWGPKHLNVCQSFALKTPHLLVSLISSEGVNSVRAPTVSIKMTSAREGQSVLVPFTLEQSHRHSSNRPRSRRCSTRLVFTDVTALK